MALQSVEEPLGSNEELFLRQDAAFIEAPGGVLLRGSSEDFFLKGGSAYRWLTALAPALSRGCTEERLCAGLDEERAAAVSRLLGQLASSGFLRARRVEGDDVLDAETSAAFAEQIAFFAHHTDTPKAAFRTVRDARVLLVGDGPCAASAARLLLRNGVRRVALCRVAAGSDDAQGAVAGVEGLEIFDERDGAAVRRRAAAWRPDALLVLPYGVPGALASDLAEHAGERGLLFLSGDASSEFLLLGPLVGTGKSCRFCLQLWLAENGTIGGAPAELFPAVSAAAGSELAAELFKQLSGCMDSELSGGVVLRDPISLESVREPLAVHLDCPYCIKQQSLREFTASVMRFAAGGADLPVESAERAAHQETAAAPRLGLLAGFDDAELPQLLVKIGRARVGGAPGPDAYGCSYDTLEAARTDAVERLARRVAAVRRTPVFMPVLTGSHGRLRGEGTDALPATAFGSPSPHTGEDPEGKDAWIPAYSLSRRVVTWIPERIAFAPALAAADPHGDMAAGYGAGATFEETALNGLLSVLLHERVRAACAGTAAVRRLDPSAAGQVSRELSILPSLRRLAADVSFTEVLGDGPERVVVAHAQPLRDSRRTAVRVAAIGLTRTDALHRAVLELAGLLQLPAEGPRLDSARSVVLVPYEEFPEARGEAEPGPGSGAEAADGGLAGLLAALRGRGREAVIVRTLPPAPAAGLPALTGRVLLTHA
ncbi:hypothetical protein OG453_30115 [Streptomyces sp. NBC_01381]|uniref:hypothetical protein n=1 Tax=Streptomyces sp. NBC_01381 TaxID=2903845 RepID=UPI002251D8D2|nr:hypothetical protein [Streptomyces sp. NBC_01381]MCX4670902.1 hypothetical protein [Streptomyces sp. NBC_01381]